MDKLFYVLLAYPVLMVAIKYLFALDQKGTTCSVCDGNNQWETVYGRVVTCPYCEGRGIN